jgi:hypothetical protein
VSESEAPDYGRSLRRLAGRLALVGGLALSLSFVLPRVPRMQVVTFRFSAAEPVRRLSASFTREGEREPASGVTLNFPGRAPASVRHEVTLPNGRYDVTVEVARDAPDGALEETSWERRVTLEGGETVLPLGDAP